MEAAVRKLMELNGLFDTNWFSIEVRILGGKPVYLLVNHFLDGTTANIHFGTVAKLTEGMETYVQQVTTCLSGDCLRGNVEDGK